MRYIRIIGDGHPNKHNAVIVHDAQSMNVYADDPDYKQYIEGVAADKRGQELEDRFSRMSYVSTQIGDMNHNVMALIKAFSMTQPASRKK
jgi:hypothetical protein